MYEIYNKILSSRIEGTESLRIENALQQLTDQFIRHGVDIGQFLLAYNGIKVLGKRICPTLKNARMRQRVKPNNAIFQENIERSERFQLRTYQVLLEKQVIEDGYITTSGVNTDFYKLVKQLTEERISPERKSRIGGVVNLIPKIQTVFENMIETFMQPNAPWGSSWEHAARQLNCLSAFTVNLLKACVSFEPWCSSYTAGLQFVKALKLIPMLSLKSEDTACLEYLGRAHQRPSIHKRHHLYSAVTPFLMVAWFKTVATLTEESVAKAKHNETIGILNHLYSTETKRKIRIFFQIYLGDEKFYDQETLARTEPISETFSKKRTAKKVAKDTKETVAPTVKNDTPAVSISTTVASTATTHQDINMPNIKNDLMLSMKLSIAIQPDKLSLTHVEAMLETPEGLTNVHPQCKGLMSDINLLIGQPSYKELANQLQDVVHQKRMQNAIQEIQSLKPFSVLSEPTRQFLVEFFNKNNFNK